MLTIEPLEKPISKSNQPWGLCCSRVSRSKCSRASATGIFAPLRILARTFILRWHHDGSNNKGARYLSALAGRPRQSSHCQTGMLSAFALVRPTQRRWKLRSQRLHRMKSFLVFANLQILERISSRSIIKKGLPDVIQYVNIQSVVFHYQSLITKYNQRTVPNYWTLSNSNQSLMQLSKLSRNGYWVEASPNTCT